MQVILETPDFQAYRGQEPPRFANKAELECAKVLDYYGVPWDYEPTTFVLEADEDGRVLEAFRPDFYLPEQNLYAEEQVMKQSLGTRKDRQLRELRLGRGHRRPRADPAAQRPRLRACRQACLDRRGRRRHRPDPQLPLQDAFPPQPCVTGGGDPARPALPAARRRPAGALRGLHGARRALRRLRVRPPREASQSSRSPRAPPRSLV